MEPELARDIGRLTLLLVIYLGAVLPLYAVLNAFRRILDTKTRRDAFYDAVSRFFVIHSNVAYFACGLFAAAWCNEMPWGVVVFAAFFGKVLMGAIALLILYSNGFARNVTDRPQVAITVTLLGACLFTFAYFVVGVLEGFVDPVALTSSVIGFCAGLGSLFSVAKGVSEVKKMLSPKKV